MIRRSFLLFAGPWLLSGACLPRDDLPAKSVRGRKVAGWVPVLGHSFR
jgi:hypothetical protein